MGCVSSNFADGVAPSPSAIKQGAHTPAMLVNKSRSKVDVQVSPKDSSTSRKRSKGHAVSTSSTAASVLDQSDYKQTSKIAGTETYQAVYTDPNGNSRGGVATQFLVQPSPESEPEKKPSRMAGLFRRSKKAPSPTVTPKANDIATRIRRRKKKGKCVEDDYQLTRQIGKYVFVSPYSEGARPMGHDPQTATYALMVPLTNFNFLTFVLIVVQLFCSDPQGPLWIRLRSHRQTNTRPCRSKDLEPCHIQEGATAIGSQHYAATGWTSWSCAIIRCLRNWRGSATCHGIVRRVLHVLQPRN